MFKRVAEKATNRTVRGLVIRGSVTSMTKGGGVVQLMDINHPTRTNTELTQD